MSREDGPDCPAETIIVECYLAEPPEKVWRALTVPELLARWLLPNDIRPEEGARFTLRPTAGAGGEERASCEVLAIEPHRLLRFSWRCDERDGVGQPLDSIVTFELTPSAVGGTHLRLVRSGFASVSTSLALRVAEAGQAISSLLASSTPHHPANLGVRPGRHTRIAKPSFGPKLRWAA